MAVAQQTYYGSGTIYEFALGENESIPTTMTDIADFVEDHCTAANELGYLKNGFQVTISTESLEDQSDLGQMKVSLVTKEEAQMTFALFNANGETISRLYATASTSNGVTTVGGLNGANQTDHVVVFVAATKVGESTAATQTVLIAMGKNTSGFTLAWNPDSVEPFSCTYEVSPFNTDGNLFVIADVAGLPDLPVT